MAGGSTTYDRILVKTSKSKPLDTVQTAYGSYTPSDLRRPTHNPYKPAQRNENVYNSRPRADSRHNAPPLPPRDENSAYLRNKNR